MQNCEWCGQPHSDFISPYCSQRCAHEAINTGYESSKSYLSTQEMRALLPGSRPHRSISQVIAGEIGKGIAALWEKLTTREINLIELESEFKQQEDILKKTGDLIRIEKHVDLYDELQRIEGDFGLLIELWNNQMWPELEHGLKTTARPVFDLMKAYCMKHPEDL